MIGVECTPANRKKKVPDNEIRKLGAEEVPIAFFIGILKWVKIGTLMIPPPIPRIVEKRAIPKEIREKHQKEGSFFCLIILGSGKRNRRPKMISKNPKKICRKYEEAKRAMKEPITAPTTTP